MAEAFAIAGYVRISVDDEKNQKNISIENQRAIIAEYVKARFPGSSLTFFRIGIAPATPLNSGRTIRQCGAV